MTSREVRNAASPFSHRELLLAPDLLECMATLTAELAEGPHLKRAAPQLFTNTLALANPDLYGLAEQGWARATAYAQHTNPGTLRSHLVTLAPQLHRGEPAGLWVMRLAQAVELAQRTISTDEQTPHSFVQMAEEIAKLAGHMNDRVRTLIDPNAPLDPSQVFLTRLRPWPNSPWYGAMIRYYDCAAGTTSGEDNAHQVMIRLPRAVPPGPLTLAELRKGIHEASLRGRVLMRIHSECHMGDIWLDDRCDCGPQLRKATEDGEALVTSRQASMFVAFYLKQEGRGIGYAEKGRIFGMEPRLPLLNGDDFMRILGVDNDFRDYTMVAKALLGLGFPRSASIELQTSNPRKLGALQRVFPNTRGRTAAITVTAHAAADLFSKLIREKHHLDYQAYSELVESGADALIEFPERRINDRVFALMANALVLYLKGESSHLAPSFVHLLNRQPLFDILVAKLRNVSGNHLPQVTEEMLANRPELPEVAENMSNNLRARDQLRRLRGRMAATCEVINEASRLALPELAHISNDSVVVVGLEGFESAATCIRKQLTDNRVPVFQLSPGDPALSQKPSKGKQTLILLADRVHSKSARLVLLDEVIRCYDQILVVSHPHLEGSPQTSNNALKQMRRLGNNDNVHFVPLPSACAEELSSRLKIHTPRAGIYLADVIARRIIAAHRGQIDSEQADPMEIQQACQAAERWGQAHGETLWPKHEPSRSPFGIIVLDPSLSTHGLRKKIEVGLRCGSPNVLKPWEANYAAQLRKQNGKCLLIYRDSDPTQHDQMASIRKQTFPNGRKDQLLCLPVVLPGVLGNIEALAAFDSLVIGAMERFGIDPERPAGLQSGRKQQASRK
jgi:GTP cyclohydrolase II